MLNYISLTFLFQKFQKRLETLTQHLKHDYTKFQVEIKIANHCPWICASLSENV